MGSDFFEIGINFIKLSLIFLLMVQMVPLLVWVERRGSAFIQNRFGPNRIGPLGLMQNLADLVKFLCKEDFLGHKGRKSFFLFSTCFVSYSCGLGFWCYSSFYPCRSGSF
ncbi:MAG: NADH-quinone oxidoreductase subunit H [Bdellovibrionales bacterium]|nr:NADH-quinone oxidoreductase subunit H [Bdellovibrionales bacterium]